MAHSPKRAEAYPTVDKLRADIDSGLMGDKIPAGDPAAAPLGTDDEAAGHGPTLEEIRDARRREIARRESIEQPDTHRGSRGFVAVGLLLAIVIVAGIAAVLGL